MVAWHCYALSSLKLPLLTHTFSPVQFSITWISPAPNLLTHKQGCKMMPPPTALTLFGQIRAPTELSSAAESWRELQQGSRSLAFYSENGGVGIECLWLDLVKLCELGFTMIPPEPISITFLKKKKETTYTYPANWILKHTSANVETERKTRQNMGILSLGFFYTIL